MDSPLAKLAALAVRADSGPTVHLTSRQFKFLTYLLEEESISAACGKSEIPETEVEKWFADVEFATVAKDCLYDKRTAAKVLGLQLMPKVLRTLSDVLETGDNKSKLTASQMLLRVQGLLIDRKETISPDAFKELMERLRQSGQPSVTITAEVKELPQPAAEFEETSKDHLGLDYGTVAPSSSTNEKGTPGK